jgi:hypothetical protein
LVGKPEGKKTGFDGRIILNWILNRVWTGLIWLRIKPSGGYL